MLNWCQLPEGGEIMVSKHVAVVCETAFVGVMWVIDCCTTLIRINSIKMWFIELVSWLISCLVRLVSYLVGWLVRLFS